MASDLVTLFAQIGIILILTKLAGWGFRYFHQPPVMGEIAAGLLLGPLCLGWLSPNLFAILFPTESLGLLNSLGQLGALLFMFLVGLKLDLRNVWNNGRQVLLIAHASVAVPLITGGVLALYLHPHISEPSVTSTIFALFVGGAMGVTALPVLARILEETGLSDHRLGTIALSAAALNDVIVWSLLAGVVGLATHSDSALRPAYALTGAGLFLWIMLTLGRGILRLIEPRYRRLGRLSLGLLALMVLTAAGSAWIAEWLGIHAFFGTFLAGAVMPKGKEFTAAVSARLEDVTTVLLLPLFFASTGLKASLNVIGGTEIWVFFGLIMLVATISMFGGTALAARFSGMVWKEAVTVGILMNTRGMMELLILSIGRDLGIISSTMFSLMVLMALTTTMMTTPLLSWWYLSSARQCFVTDHGQPDPSKSL